MATLPQINRSRRILSGRGEDESISRARTAMTSFDRVWSSTRQTAVEQPRRKQFLRLFCEHLKAYTDEFGELSLNVSPSALSLDGQAIFKVDRKRENYINRLFLHDIRQLVFYPELTEDELLRFIAILRTDFTSPDFLEDDIVTLLWHENLSGIGYSVYDTTEEQTAEDKDAADGMVTGRRAKLSQAQTASDAMDAASSGMLMDADEIMAQAMSEQVTTTPVTDKPEYGDLPIVVSAGDKLMRDLTSAPLATALEDLDHAFSFTPQQAKALRDQLRACDEIVATKFGEILLQALQGLPDHAAEQILQGFGNFALSSLGLASETSLAQVLKAMTALGHTPEGNAFYMQLLGKMQDPEVMDALVNRMEASQLSEGLFKLVNVMGGDNFPLLWQRMLSLTNASARQNLLRLLTPFASHHLPFLLEQVARGPEDAAMQALSLLQEVPVSDIADDLLAGLRHASPSIRLAVAERVRQVHTPTVQQTLLDMINDAEEQVRLAVMQILVDTQSPGIEPALLAAIRKPGFSRRNLEEKRRTISGLGKVVSRDGLVLLRHLALGSPTSPVKGDQDTQIAAIRALASRADRDALPGLKKLARAWFGNKELKRAARFAVAVINRQVGTS